VGFRGTRNHHQSTKTRRLEATPVRRPRVGQRTIPLSTPTLSPIHVPWTSPWNYKRGDLGADTGHGRQHKTYVVEQPYSILVHTTPVFTPVQALRCKIIQLSSLAGRRAFSCPNQNKSLCLFLHHHLERGARIQVSLVGVTPRGENTDKHNIWLLLTMMIRIYKLTKGKIIIFL